jgi:hypothetical protein
MNAYPSKTLSSVFAYVLTTCLLTLCANVALAAAAPATSAATSTTPAVPTVLTEAQKIQALIHGIEVMKDARFVRNGSDYGGAAAADHLRLKLRNAGSRVKTAQDFITLLASKSSMSGLPYKIRFADGHEIESGQYFRTQLAIIEHTAPAIRPTAATPAPTH